MRRNQIKLGLVISSFITVALLPARLSQGQGKDAVNLIGSEVGIWCLCFSSWALTCYLQKTKLLKTWQKVITAFLCCSILSVLFYHVYNPYFEDYPLEPVIRLDPWIGTFRLALRGIMLGIIVVPIVFYLENTRILQAERIAAERRRSQDFEEHNKRLEYVVAQRTASLHETVISLELAQKQLHSQMDLQLRLLASISHDVAGPFKFLIRSTQAVRKMVNEGKVEVLPTYFRDLDESLTDIHGFLQNILSFTRTQIRQTTILVEPVSLVSVIEEKLQFFQGTIARGGNTLCCEVDDSMYIETSRGLFSIIIHNLIDNASKYTYDGTIQVSTEKNENFTQLIIRNSGTDTPLQIVNWVNQSAPESGYNEIPRESGVGLLLVKQICDMLKLTLKMNINTTDTEVRLLFSADQMRDALAGGESLMASVGTPILKQWS